jgi:hypothetical protein
MHFLSFGSLAAIFVAITNIAQALVLDSNHPTIDLANVTIKSTGRVSPGLNNRDSTPAECQFDDPNPYYYIQFTLDSPHTACMGWDEVNQCGNGRWSDQDYNDLFQVVTDQVAQDGLLKSSREGIWFCSFDNFSTAFDNRDASTLFSWGIYLGYGVDKQYNTWYFSYDNNWLRVILYTSICPGLP